MQVNHPWTCTCVRLLGPCFKTGQKTHTCLRGHASWHIDSQINQCRMLVCTNMHAWFRKIHMQACIIPPGQICWHTILVSAIIVRNTMYTQYHWMRAEQQPMTTTNATHCNLTLHCNFCCLHSKYSKHCWTFLSKSCSQFPHCTCLLSVALALLSLSWALPLSLHSISKEHDSWRHTIHKRLHTTTRMFTFIAAFSQKTYMCTSLGSATSNYNAQPQAAVSDLSCSLFIRYYYRNPFQFIILRLLICLNSAGLLAKQHVVMACSCTKGNAASQTTHEFAHCAHLLFNVVSHNSNSIIVYAF